MKQSKEQSGPDIWRRMFQAGEDWHEREKSKPEAMRIKETERIVTEWAEGGYEQFCQLLERASQGRIAERERARAILPTLLEVIHEEDMAQLELERTEQREKFGFRRLRDEALTKKHDEAQKQATRAGQRGGKT